MLPVLIQVGPVKIYSMGVALVMAFLMGMYWWWKMGRDENWEEIALFDGYFLASLGFLLTARAGYVVMSGEIQGFWQAVALLLRPGLNYLAGFVGGWLVMVMFARARGMAVWKMMDSLAVVTGLVVVWGSLGSLLSRGELWLDGWGIGWSVVSFGLVTVVRKNFRFYGWYKGEASVAKDGLATLVLLALLGVYYMGRGAIEQSWWQAAAGGVGLVVAGVVIYLRSGGVGKLSKRGIFSRVSSSTVKKRE